MVTLNLSQYGFQHTIHYIHRMKMTVFDRSECFRAFLLLIGQDGVITQEERSLLLEIGKVLDFERRFSETAIDDLLENRYISTEPPLFSHYEFAAAFLKDAIRIAFADKDVHDKELVWLESIAKRNSLKAGWVSDEIELYRRSNSARSTKFEISRCVTGD
jgi:tellurite resistance protein